MLEQEKYSQLIPRYNQPGPRYTSYPTVPNWESGEFAEDYKTFLSARNGSDEGISLYVHLPFCRKLCTFCGCNKVIANKQEKADLYLDSLENEIRLITEAMSSKQKVKQLHLGGGTPTFLTVAQLERLWGMLDENFDTSTSEETALEVHPNVTTREQMQALYDFGFRRISFGVQDLDEKVQDAINRHQTVEKTEETILAARDIGFESVNVDLVYGLPYQTQETFSQTIEHIGRWQPERLAVYSFAYIPNMFKTHEKVIKEEYLPVPVDKMALYLEAKRQLLDKGYVMIGMDHFAKPDDEMGEAFHNRKLHRNFMGYTVLDGMNQIGLGVSSISDFGNAYFQNEKEHKEYQSIVDGENLASIRMTKLNQDDLIRRELIQNFMCYLEVDTEGFSKKHNINFNEYFAEPMKQLKGPEEDELVTISNNKIKITELGCLFMRNVVMPFDAYLSTDKPLQNFSKTV